MLPALINSAAAGYQGSVNLELLKGANRPVPWHYDNTQCAMADQQNARFSSQGHREKQIKRHSLTMAFTQHTEKTIKSTLSKCFNVLQTYQAAKDIPCIETNVKRRCSCSIRLPHRQQKDKLFTSR